MKIIKVKTAIETLNTVSAIFQSKNRAVYSRFGDGDIYIMLGKDDMYQEHNELLANELVNAFSVDNHNYLIAVGINTPREKGMMDGLFAPFPTNSMMENYISTNFKIKSVYENFIFLHYLAVFQPKIILKFFQDNIIEEKKMFIGSIGQGKVEKIIGKVDKYIPVPAINAYNTIGDWWPQIEANLQYVDLVIVAAGISGRAVNKRIWDTNINVKSFDIGSIVDITDDKITRKWIDLAGHRIQRYFLKDKTQSFSYFKKELKLRIRGFLKGWNKI